MPGLAGKTALVTGASRGMGKSTAEPLARDGACVGVHYGRNEQAALETVAAIEAVGGSASLCRQICARRWESSWKIGNGLDEPVAKLSASNI